MEREYQVGRNRQVLEAMVGHRSLTLPADEVATILRADRDG